MLFGLEMPGKAKWEDRGDEHLATAITEFTFSVNTSHNPVRLILTSILQMRKQSQRS